MLRKRRPSPIESLVDRSQRHAAASPPGGSARGDIGADKTVEVQLPPELIASCAPEATVHRTVPEQILALSREHGLQAGNGDARREVTYTRVKVQSFDSPWIDSPESWQARSTENEESPPPPGDGQGGPKTPQSALRQVDLRFLDGLMATAALLLVVAYALWVSTRLR